MNKKKKLTGFGAVLAAIAAAFVASRGGSKPPAPPAELPAEIVAMHRATCEAIWLEELRRPIDADGLQSCLANARNGGTAETIRAGVRASEEYRKLHEAPPVLPPVALLPIRTDGRFFITDHGTFRPLFQSGLALLARGPPERVAFLDQTRALGFNGIRVFAGDLGWVGQTPAIARANLPALLDEAAARGLYVYVCAITGGRDPVYDIDAHLRAIVAIVAGRPNVLLELANEIGHPTLSERATVDHLIRLGREIPPGVVWTVGAPIGTDEPEPDGRFVADGGLFNDAHLDRGRDLYNQVRRLREIYAISENTRKPAMSGEPIGMAEVPMPGKQRLWGDDALRFSFTYGALCRGFELGCVFHSEQGLHGEVIGPNTQAAARAYLDGWRAIDTTDRLLFVNAGWQNSPVRGANFDSGITRAYSFVTGGRGWTVLVGVRGDPRVEWGGGWRPVRVVADRPGTQIIEIAR